MSAATMVRATLDIPPTVLSFRGPLGCGKTTAARHFSDTYANVVKISFADALKIEVFDALWVAQIPQAVYEHFGRGCLDKWIPPWSDFPGIARDKISNAAKLGWINSNKTELRELLQYWGTEFRRSQDEGYWVNQWVRAARLALNEGYTVVVDDARFPNERTIIKDGLGGYEIYLDSTEDFQVGRDGTADKGITGHESERYNDPSDPDIDFIVRNSPGLDELYAKLELIVRNFIGSKNYNPRRMGSGKGTVAPAVRLTKGSVDE